MHSFKASLSKAQFFTETKFASWYPAVTFTDGREFDFFNEAAEACELKLDFYKKGSNIFIETHSNYDKNRPGGPWQTKLHGTVKWFVYARCEHSEVLWFDLDKLLEFCDANLEKYRRVFVPNRTYRGSGILVPREDLIHLATKVDVFPEELH